jgi:hypothetical protein
MPTVLSNFKIKSPQHRTPLLHNLKILLFQKMMGTCRMLTQSCLGGNVLVPPGIPAMMIQKTLWMNKLRTPIVFLGLIHLQILGLTCCAMAGVTFTNSDFMEPKLLKILNNAHIPHFLYQDLLNWAKEAKQSNYEQGSLEPTREVLFF